MALKFGLALTQVVWNSNTWDKDTDGGVLTMQARKNGQPVNYFTGDDVYPRVVEIVDRNTEVRIALASMDAIAQTLGAGPSNLVCTVKQPKGAGTIAITYATMVLKDVESGQGQNEQGGSVLVFVHESADGSTEPVSTV